MANATSAAIEPGTLYSLDEAKRRTGWGTHSFRKARRQGLTVLYSGGRAFVEGSELIRFISETAKRSS